MKIISGKLKGREIKNPNISTTRPTMDRVKESIFSSIQDYIKDSICLDLFAGTGNLGIEAISNGCDKCYFIDNNVKSINYIKKITDDFDISNKSIIMKKDYNSALKYFSSNDISFDIIFLDPPYNYKVLKNILNYIYENKIINKNGIIICEYESDNINSDDTNFELLKHKKYGSKFVSIFKSNV